MKRVNGMSFRCRMTFEERAALEKLANEMGLTSSDLMRLWLHERMRLPKGRTA